ncbi:MAG: T9SS type A sorting domain-containing protein, partial [Saprospiraceae bacterium]|nr:T9SS type A sorting domain-containing protein [Saprospiraceae bacterium]
DYTDDACMSMFTPLQRRRALLTIHLFRRGLLEASACQTWGPAPLEDDLQVYPNPSRDLVYIIPPESWQAPFSYTLYDPLGTKIWEGVFQGVIFSLNMNPLATGPYYLRIEIGDSVFTKTIIRLP